MLAVAATLAGPATARGAEEEIEVDLSGVRPQFSRRPTYGTPFNLVVQLPQGSRAVLRYWPVPRGSGSCEVAHTKLTGKPPPELLESPTTGKPRAGEASGAEWAVSQTFAPPTRTVPGNGVEERLGVVGAASAGNAVKVSFRVDRLLAGVPYCFQIHRTVFRSLAPQQQQAAQDNLRATLDATLAERVKATPYASSTCSPADRAALVANPAAIKTCMIRHEFTQKAPALAKLPVRHPDHADTLDFGELIERELAANEAARLDAERYILARHVMNLQIASWENERKQLQDVDRQPKINEALAKVRQLVRFELGEKAVVEDARALACATPAAEIACLRLKRMEGAYTFGPALAEAGKLTEFSAFVRDVTQVREVAAEAKAMEIAEPTFSTRFPFWISLDVGAAVVPFPDHQVRLAQYVGVNFYARPVDRDEPLRFQKHFPGRWFTKRLSLTVGITTTGSLLRSEDGVDGVLGKQFVMLGGGFRVTRLLRLGAGAIFYRQASQNPAGGPSRTGAAPYVGLSMDIDVVNWIRGKIKGS